MVRKKTLSPSGATDDDGEHRNAQININQAELDYSGLDIGDEVYVRTEKGRIIIEDIEYSDID